MTTYTDEEILLSAARMVRRARKHFGSFRKLARTTGVSAATLCRIANLNLNPSVTEANRIAASIGETWHIGKP